MNQVRWFGSLRGLHADADVRESCEQAVKLSHARDTLDSCALNLALNGDYQGAIEDFEVSASDPL